MRPVPVRVHFPCSLALATALFAAFIVPPAHAEESAVKPGLYAALRLQADAPGLVRVRGDGSLGIDWPAGGRGFVDVPWMTWRDPAGPAMLTINGAAMPASPAPVAAFDAPMAGPGDAMPRESAYVPTTAWAPGRGAATRRWAVLAAGIAVLAVAATGVATHGRRWAALGVMAVSIAITTAVLASPTFRRRDATLRVGIAVETIAGTMRDIWIYRTAREPARVREPWPADGTLWFVPRSLAHLGRADPVLHVDAVGRPLAIEVSVAPGEPAAFLYRDSTTASLPALEDATASPELARRLYGGMGKTEEGWTIIHAGH